MLDHAHAFGGAEVHFATEHGRCRVGWRGLMVSRSGLRASRGPCRPHFHRRRQHRRLEEVAEALGVNAEPGGLCVELLQAHVGWTSRQPAFGQRGGGGFLAAELLGQPGGGVVAAAGRPY